MYFYAQNISCIYVYMYPMDKWVLFECLSYNLEKKWSEEETSPERVHF